MKYTKRNPSGHVVLCAWQVYEHTDPETQITSYRATRQSPEEMLLSDFYTSDGKGHFLPEYCGNHIVLKSHEVCEFLEGFFEASEEGDNTYSFYIGDLVYAYDNKLAYDAVKSEKSFTEGRDYETRGEKAKGFTYTDGSKFYSVITECGEFPELVKHHLQNSARLSIEMDPENMACIGCTGIQKTYLTKKGNVVVENTDLSKFYTFELFEPEDYAWLQEQKLAAGDNFEEIKEVIRELVEQGFKEAYEVSQEAAKQMVLDAAERVRKLIEENKNNK